MRVCSSLMAIPPTKVAVDKRMEMQCGEIPKGIYGSDCVVAVDERMEMQCGNSCWARFNVISPSQWMKEWRCNAVVRRSGS